jgi:predicted Zn-dependent protease
MIRATRTYPRSTPRIRILTVLTLTALTALGAVAESAEEPGVAGSDSAAARSATVERKVAVVPPWASPPLSSVRDGAREWLQQTLAASEGTTAERGLVAAAAVARLSADHPFLLPEDAAAVAQATNSQRILWTELEYDAGTSTVRLRIYDRDGKRLAAAEASAPLAELGSSLAGSLEQVNPKLVRGASAPAAPTLAELGAYGRSLAELERGDFAKAWRELAALETPTAKSLRQEIVDRGSAPQVPPAARSRLATARGVKDRDWLRVRQGLIAGKDPAMLIAGGNSAEARGNHQQALDLYDQAAARDPGSLAAKRGRARSLQQLGRHQAAADTLQQVVGQAPDDLQAYAALAQNPDASPIDRAEALLAVGDLHAQRLDRIGANDAYGAAGGMAPAVRLSSQEKAAQLELLMGNDGDALVAYEGLHAAGGAKDPQTLVGLGRARRRSGDLGGAQQALAAAHAADPDAADVQQELGMTLIEQGEPDQAVVHLQQAVRLQPANASARRALARAHRDAGNPDAALQVLDPTAVGAADRALLLQDAAEVHESQGRLQEATIVLQEAQSIRPDHAPLVSAMARVYETAGASSRRCWASISPH